MIPGSFRLQHFAALALILLFRGHETNTMSGYAGMVLRALRTPTAMIAAQQVLPFPASTYAHACASASLANMERSSRTDIASIEQYSQLSSNQPSLCRIRLPKTAIAFLVFLASPWSLLYSQGDIKQTNTKKQETSCRMLWERFAEPVCI